MPGPNQPSRPLEAQIPPASVASPSDADWLGEPGLPFWKPTWRDLAKYVGWRWVFLLPAVLLVIILLMIPLNPHWLQFIWIGGGKLLLLAVGLPLSALTYAMKHAVTARKDPFCIHCGYGLTGLPDNHRCPECGRPYTFKLIEEYKRDPNWFIQRCKAHRQLPVPVQGFAAGKFRRKKKSRDGT